MNTNHWHLDTPYGELTGTREKLEAYVLENPAIYNGKTVTIWRNSCEEATFSAAQALNDDDIVAVEGWGTCQRRQAHAIGELGVWGPYIYNDILRAAFTKAASGSAYKEVK